MHTELSSVAASFPTRHGSETQLTLVIEQATRETFDGEEVEGRKADPPRMCIKPTHGWGGLTRAECVWLLATMPELWDEWERKVGAR